MKGIIGENRPAVHVAMFGMQDPSQTLLQIERYMQGGRLETLRSGWRPSFCDMMLANKKRDVQQQIFLLKGLRLMCDVYMLRDKSQSKHDGHQENAS